MNWTTTAKRRWIQITDWKSSTRLKSTTKAEAHWSRGSILIHCKGVVRGFPHMAFNVVTDHLISDLTHSSTEVTTCPNMLTPVTFFKMWELLLQHARRTALDFLHYLTRRQMRWGWNQDVNSAIITRLRRRLKRFRLKAKVFTSRMENKCPWGHQMIMIVVEIPSPPIFPSLTIQNWVLLVVRSKIFFVQKQQYR